MRVALSLAVVGAGLHVAVGGCGASGSECDAGAYECDPEASNIAQFMLTCAPNDLTSVTASSPCMMGWTTLSEGKLVLIGGAANAGTCHVVLTFATGYTYAVDATFTESTATGCGACPGLSGGVYLVNNPPDTRVALPDAGDDE